MGLPDRRIVSLFVAVLIYLSGDPLSPVDWAYLGDGKPQNLARREGGDQLTASTDFEEPEKTSEEVLL